MTKKYNDSDFIVPKQKIYHKKPLKKKIYRWGTGIEIPYDDYKDKKIVGNQTYSIGDMIIVNMYAFHYLRTLKKLSPYQFKRLIKKLMSDEYD